MHVGTASTAPAYVSPKQAEATEKLGRDHDGDSDDAVAAARAVPTASASASVARSARPGRVDTYA